jgi:hypothetical protein
VFNSDPARNNVRSVIDYLFESGYLKAKHIPLSRGRTRYLINQKPINQDGDEMIYDKELENGMVFESNYSTSDCASIIEELTGTPVRSD